MRASRAKARRLRDPRDQQPFLSLIRSRNGAVAATEDFDQGRWESRFDFANRAVALSFPDNTERSTEYWPGTHAAKRSTDRSGVDIEIEYDAYRRPASIGTPSGTLVSYLRDARGILEATSVNDDQDPSATVTLDFVRDTLGRPVVERSNQIGGSLRRTLDVDNRSDQLIVSGRTLTTMFDPTGRPEEILLDGTVLASFEHFGRGPPTARTFANGVTIGETYDERLRPRTIDASIGATSLFSSDRRHAENGSLARVDVWAYYGPNSTELYGTDDLGHTSLYAYASPPIGSNGLSGRITQAEIDTWSSSANQTTRYQYSGADAWVVVDTGNQSIEPSFDRTHRYIDFDGRITSDLDGRILESDSDGRIFTYDELGRLITAKDNQGEDWRFGYDAFGRLAFSELRDRRTHFQHEGDRLLRELPDGSAETLYVAEAPIAMVRSGDVIYTHALWGDRTSFAVDETQKIVEQYRYSAFGAPDIRTPSDAPLTSSSIGNRVLVGGSPYFPELGLHRHGQRWYDPTLGQFLTPDPLGMIDGPNVFQYAGGNPIMFTDFSGLGKENKLGTYAHDLGFGSGEFAAEKLNGLRRLLDPSHSIGVEISQAITDELIRTGDPLAAINVINPANAALTNGYDAMVALENQDGRGFALHGLRAIDAALSTILPARGLGKSGAMKLSDTLAQGPRVHGVAGAVERSIQTRQAVPSEVSARTGYE